jgi:prophage maintenance system killer protein
MNKSKKGEIVIYKSKDGQTQLDVQLKEETVWLTQAQIVELFQRDQSVISRHINRVFSEGELERKSNMQKMHIAISDKPVAFYNLDVIISVGYRVKSKRGTQFRIWANRVLKEYIIQGYALNEKRLKEQIHKYEDLQKSIKLIGSVAQRKRLSSGEAEGLIQLVSEYAYAMDVLDQFDKKALKIKNTSRKQLKKVTYPEALKTVNELKKKLGGSDLFGREKDQSFQSSLNAIYQTIKGEDCYPSIEEKAAHLLYFIVKNHSFVDGNKRIAAFIFIWFLKRNGVLYKKDRSRLIADNALVALTLLIATSNPEDKDIIIKVIVNLINKNN